MIRRLLLARAALTASIVAPVHAAVVVDTGAGTAPPFFLIGPQTRSHSQFTLTQPTRITGIEFYGFVIVPGTFQYSIAYTGADEPGLFYAPYSQALGANGEAWYGISGLDLELQPGNYWLGLGNDGGTSYAYHYGNAPSALGNDAIYFPKPFPLSSYTDADPVNFSWRVSGQVIAAASGVPEPGTWMLTILGVGLTGAALRRRISSAPAKPRLTLT